MFTNIPNESKLNSFTPVHIPKVRDVFRRRGAMRTTDTASSLDSRNPLEHFDSESMRMSDFYYQRYREQVESDENHEVSESDEASECSTDS